MRFESRMARRRAVLGRFLGDPTADELRVRSSEAVRTSGRSRRSARATQ